MTHLGQHTAAVDQSWSLTVLLLQINKLGEITLGAAYPGAVASKALLDEQFTPDPFKLVRDRKPFLQGGPCAACCFKVIHHPAHPIIFGRIIAQQC